MIRTHPFQQLANTAAGQKLYILGVTVWVNGEL